MATTKKSTAAKETKEVKESAKAVKATKAAAKKPAVKPEVKEPVKEAVKAPAKKAAPKKAVAEKAPAESAKVSVFVEFGGAQVSIDKVIEDAKLTSANAKEYRIYLKPEESKAYIVADGATSEMDVYFC